MNDQKKDLKNLIDFVIEIANQKGNEWFKNDLQEKLLDQNYPNELNEIYEYCIRQILKEHSIKFYSDFKINSIKNKLVDDFIRMEKFRREDHFEDFCLAAYQQIESITNELIKPPEFLDFIRQNKDVPAIYKYDVISGKYIPKGNQTIGKLVFVTSDVVKINGFLNSSAENWYFNHKLRAVIYYYYFNKEIRTNTEHFDRIYEIGNFLYQGRNLNHRGGNHSGYQTEILNLMIPNQHKYYFKFLGFLEDFVSEINRNIK